MVPYRGIFLLLLPVLVFLVGSEAAGKGAKRRNGTTASGSITTIAPTTGTDDQTTVLTTKALKSRSLKPKEGSESPKAAKGSGRRSKERNATRTARQAFSGMGFPAIGFGSGVGSGTGLSTGSAQMGNTFTNGNTFTDPFGRSVSSASGLSSGVMPVSTSIANSNSAGMNTFPGGLTGTPFMNGVGRRKRQIPSFPLTFPAAYPYMQGTGAGTGLSTGTALSGSTQTGGNTFTDTLGRTLSNANGASAGYQPSSTSVANSNSAGTGASPFMMPSPFMPSPFMAGRQFPGVAMPGYPVSTGAGTGSAVGTGSALSGNTATGGNTFTDPMGRSVSNANGMSAGTQPVSTAAANSNTNSAATGAVPTATMPGRRKRQIGYPMGMPFGSGMGSGTGLSTGSAQYGSTTTNGNTFTDPFGRSMSSANGMSSGFMPQSTSIANSNSQGMMGMGMPLMGRRKRQIGFPMGTPFSSGVGSGTGLSTGSAQYGTTTTNGNTFTDPFGRSMSSANGMSSGFMPQSTSIANSNSQGMMGMGMPFMGRRKRQIGGYGMGGMGGFGGYPGYGGSGSGMGLSTGSAQYGSTNTMGNTMTDPFGNSRSLASGMSSGYGPTSTSIANSNSQGYGNPYGMMGMQGRRKRQASYYPNLMGGGFGYPGSASGTALVNAGALQGTSRSAGNTMTFPGSSASSGQGMAMGSMPMSTSVISSAAHGWKKRDVDFVVSAKAFIDQRHKREAETLAFGPNDTVNHEDLAQSKKKLTSPDLKATHIPDSSFPSKNSDHEMVSDEHLEGPAFASEIVEARDKRSSATVGYMLVPMTYAQIIPAASQDYGYAGTLPYGNSQYAGNNQYAYQQMPQTGYMSNPFGRPSMDAPTYRNAAPPMPMPGAGGFGGFPAPMPNFNNNWPQNVLQPTINRFLSSDGPLGTALSQADAALKSGKGTLSGTVSTSSNNPDGTVTNKRVNFGLPCDPSFGNCQPPPSSSGMQNDQATPAPVTEVTHPTAGFAANTTPALTSTTTAMTA